MWFDCSKIVWFFAFPLFISFPTWLLLWVSLSIGFIPVGSKNQRTCVALLVWSQSIQLNKRLTYDLLQKGDQGPFWDVFHGLKVQCVSRFLSVQFQSSRVGGGVQIPLEATIATPILTVAIYNHTYRWTTIELEVDSWMDTTSKK